MTVLSNGAATEYQPPDFTLAPPLPGLRFGSICSGIEAASVAWEPLGFRAAWVAEVDKFPSAVLAHHWPDVPNLGDMTKIPEGLRLGTIEKPDVLVGGTPCQAFSVAGLRGGMADPRGALTIKYVEILDELREDCIAVWENVPGVLSSKDNAFGCFLGALVGEDRELKPSGKRWTNAGCVYGPKRTAAWRVLDAQYFGVAQRRRRVFVIASAREGFDPCAVLFESEGVRRDTPPSRETGSGVAALTANGVGTCGADDNQAQAGHLVAETQYGPVAGALTARHDSSPCADRGPNIIACMHETGPDFWTGGDIAGTLRAEGENRPSRPSNVIKLGGPESQVRRLTPVECARLQGFPDGHTDVPWRGKPVTPDGPQYKAYGNSMAVPVMRWIGARIKEQLK